MKKAPTEVGNQQLTSRLEARLDEIEKRLERLDPQPKLETLQPYKVGSNVYGISDLEARYPLLVLAYDRPGYVTVRVTPNDPERSLPLASVRRLEECPRGQPNPSQRFANITDPKARAYFEGREAAALEAKTKPFTPPLPPQERYGPAWYPRGQ